LVGRPFSIAIVLGMSQGEIGLAVLKQNETICILSCGLEAFAVTVE